MILFNGCSFTWGDELPGHEHNPPTHNHLTFAHKLSDMFGESYSNLASCGGGNDKIFRDTVRFLHDANARNELPTKVVILWSAWQRMEVAEAMSQVREDQLKIQRWECMTQISPQRLDCLTPKHRKLYKAFFEDGGSWTYRTDVLHGLQKMVNMQLLCDSLGVKLVQGVFHSRMWNNVLAIIHPKHREEGWGDFMDSIKWHLDALRPECKIGLGHSIDFFEFAKRNYGLHQFGHPNAPAHSAYAKLLYDEFITAYS